MNKKKKKIRIRKLIYGLRVRVETPKNLRFHFRTHYIMDCACYNLPVLEYCFVTIKMDDDVLVFHGRKIKKLFHVFRYRTKPDD